MSGADLVEKRRPLTRAETIAICVRQNGRCGCGCGKPLNPFTEGVIDEHIIPLELTGSNDLSNRAYYRKPCAAEKTVKDAADIAKAKRLAGEVGIGRRKQEIKSAGFSSRTRKFNGSIGPTKKAARAALENDHG